MYNYNKIEREDGIMSLAFAEFTEKLVSISDFSQGKAGKIFSDVYENNNEYIVLKNNQPTAVVISVHEYKETQRKIEQLERILDMMENMRLLKIAESRKNNTFTSFEDFVAEEGFDMKELEAMCESVEIE